ncbi:hypothetical protein BJ170DRAFT_678148 [Xylariales sp. AK1849]|nr:hypothetical protein BJ170DRAFT_678148 [Xylariales sp. AK1849]
MADSTQNLSHEEVWDDRALVNSWNEALEEYKKYHSIHSKGGNVEELRNANKTNSSDAKMEEDVPEVVASAEDGAESEVNGNDENGNPEVPHSGPSAERSTFIPAPLLGSVRDESLKKLLISWYYAGYYTGYYEGQREQSQQH